MTTMDGVLTCVDLGRFDMCNCMLCFVLDVFFFFFNDTATTEIYTLSLHDALPILPTIAAEIRFHLARTVGWWPQSLDRARSEEHTSELQSHVNLVCRLLLEKKKKTEYK